MAAVHHYVPRFLLRNFCSGTKPRLWAYDKSAGKSFETTIQSVAGERDFYEVTVGDFTVSLEEGLSKLESEARTIINRIINARSIGVMSEDDRILLAVFVATQMQRVPHSRENLLALSEGFSRVMKERFGMDTDDFPAMTPEIAKALSIKSLTEPNQFAEHILNKSWLLFETADSTPFYISDNPVALQNNVEPRGPLRGNLGLAVPGIEIYLPLSSTLTLGFYCCSHEEMIRNGVEKMRRSIVRDPNFPMTFGPLLDWMRAFRKGTPLTSTADNVLNHNSLQVRQAERYVFSSQPDFELVESMIADDSRFRKGPRPEIA